jgi:hypothetical protein
LAPLRALSACCADARSCSTLLVYLFLPGWLPGSTSRIICPPLTVFNAIFQSGSPAHPQMSQVGVPPLYPKNRDSLGMCESLSHLGLPSSGRKWKVAGCPCEGKGMVAAVVVSVVGGLAGRVPRGRLKRPEQQSPEPEQPEMQQQQQCCSTQHSCIHTAVSTAPSAAATI